MKERPAPGDRGWQAEEGSRGWPTKGWLRFVFGNASEAALSNLYYPAVERGFSKSAKNFATQTVITAGANVLKEFWPDVRKNVFRMKDESPPRP